jgi:hypothetical protein
LEVALRLARKHSKNRIRGVYANVHVNLRPDGGAVNPKERESRFWTETRLKMHLRDTPMRAVVPAHVDVAVRRPAQVAGEVVAKC